MINQLNAFSAIFLSKYQQYFPVSQQAVYSTFNQNSAQSIENLLKLFNVVIF
jgi:hypothetical protein